MNDLLFKDWLQKWLLEQENLIKESSCASFDLHIQNHIIPYFKEYKLKEVDNNSIQEFIYYLSNKGRLDGTGGLAVATIRDIILVVKLSLKEAARKNLIDKPVFDLKYPKVYVDDQLVTLTKEEQRKLVQAVYLDLTPKSVGLLISSFCSLRIGELCALKWSDINFADKTITINKTLQRIYKKGCKSKITIGPPKTESSYRIIPIPSQLALIMQKIQSKSNYYVLTGTKNYTEPRTYRRYYQNFMRKNELPQIKFHGLRHTFATRAIENPEFDIKSLAYVMGHKNPSFTLNVYGRSNLSQSRKCMESLNSML